MDIRHKSETHTQVLWKDEILEKDFSTHKTPSSPFELAKSLQYWSQQRHLTKYISK